MNYGNCDITIKTENGECFTYTASCVSIDCENDYVDVQSCGSPATTRMLFGTRYTMKAELCPKLCEEIKPCNPPKKPGLLKRIIRKIV